MRDAFESWTGKGQFSGHETFPLRLLWLKKAYEAVAPGVSPAFFTEPDAISRFGVGRNMAVSMRHWAVAAGMIEESDRKLVTTPLGRALLGEDGWDPYLERTATLWLIHWKLASTPERTTTFYFAFNAIAAPEFEATALVESLAAEAARRSWAVSSTTLKRDVEVLLRSYVRRRDSSIEDAAEPLLAELGILREIKSATVEFVKGPKTTLPDHVFAYALGSFWKTFGDVKTLSAEQICYGPGSPGRVFKLDEDSIVARLMTMSELTKGAWMWTDNAGLRQIQRSREVDLDRTLSGAFPAASRGTKR